MTNAIEAHIGNLWRSKQATPGTIEPSTSASMKQVRKATDEGLKAAKTYAMEEYVDGQSWGSPGSVVDTVGGDVGSVGWQAQIETAGVAMAHVCGTDTVTGTSPNYTHTITTTPAQGILNTFYMKTGATVYPFRQAWWDARQSKVTWTASQDQKFARIVEQIMCLKAATWFTTDPTATDSGTDPYNWNEVANSIVVNSVTLPEVNSETIEFDRKVDVERGDNAAPVCFKFGKGTISRSLATFATDQTLPIIQYALYGTSSPAGGAAVTNQVIQVPVISTYTRNSNRSISYSTPLLEIEPQDFEIAPRPEGGTIPVTFSGRCKASAGVIATTVAKTGDAGAYI